MNARKKQHNAWHKELVADWIDKGYPQQCERCGSGFALSFAHSKKRRMIASKEDYFTVCLLCQGCHHFIEYGDLDNAGTHERMEKEILAIIANRAS